MFEAYERLEQEIQEAESLAASESEDRESQKFYREERDKLLTKRAGLEKQLEEGYRASAKESIALAREFEAADLEGWDEY